MFKAIFKFFHKLLMRFLIWNTMRHYQSDCVHISLVCGEKSWEKMSDFDKLMTHFRLTAMGFDIDNEYLIRRRKKK